MNLFTKKLVIVSLAILLAFGVFLRSWNLDEVRPIMSDELQWVLLGTSVITTGTPTSWTVFYSIYQPSTLQTYAGIPLNVVTPNLDNPIAFALIMGAWERLTHDSNLTTETVSWGILRIPMIVITALLLALTLLYVWRLHSPELALFVGIASAFMPTYVITTRFIGTELFIALLWVIALTAYWYTSHASKNRRKQLLGIIIFICCVSLLVKLSAIVIPLSLVLIAGLEKRYARAAAFTGALFVSVLLFIGYLAYYDLELGMHILNEHNNRPQSLHHFWTFFTPLRFNALTIADASTTMGWIGILAMAVRSSTPPDMRRYLLASLLALSAAFVAIAPAESYGWYKLISMPFLSIGLGYIYWKLFEGEDIWYVMLLPAIGSTLQHAYPVADVSTLKMGVLLLYVAVGIVILYKHYSNRSIFARITASAVISILICTQAVWALQILTTFR